MGREARCRGRWPGGEGELKALLESEELILRGDYKARWPFSALSPTADDGWLVLATPEGEIALQLGEAAANWCRKIGEPPASLADKLGIKPTRRVLVVGEVEDPNLQEALALGLAQSAAQAELALAVIHSAAELDAALEAHAALPHDTPIWLVNVKGKKSPFSEDQVRGALRSKGFIDSKTASVSASLAATRYARRKA